MVECLTWDRRGRLRASPASVRCGPWARHIYPSLVLVQPRNTRPCLTEKLLMGRKESNQTNKNCRSRIAGFSRSQLIRIHTVSLATYKFCCNKQPCIWAWWNTGPEVIKLFSCSTQLNTKFILLINFKMPTIVGKKFLYLSVFLFLWAVEISTLSWDEHEKSFLTSCPGFS